LEPVNRGNKHLVVPCTIRNANGTTFSTSSFIDSGATGRGFYDTEKAHERNLTIYKLKKPKRLFVADGSPSSAGDITHATDLTIEINGHTETMTFYLTNLGRYEALLGKPWLYVHDPQINWRKDSLLFNSSYCQKHCIPKDCGPIKVSSCKDSTQGPPRRVGAAAFHTLAQQHGTEIFSLSLHDIDKRLYELGGGESIEQIASIDTRYSIRYDTGKSGIKQMNQHLYEKQYYRTKDELPYTKRCAKAAEMIIAGFSAEEIADALKPKVYTDPATVLPQHLHHHLHVFDAKAADVLPPHRHCDHKIKLQPGTTPPSGPLYNMSVEELTVLRKFLQENLDKGFIRASTSPAASPVLFAKKPGGGLRFCVDYRGLNAITIKNRYPLPLIQETLSRLSKAKFYTKLDVIGAFNQIRIAEGDEWMTAFNTRYGLFETLVMPFGLTNAPATFQARINEILRPFLDIYCTAYIDDILIYSDNLKEHRKHVNAILTAIGEVGLKLDIKKCAFEVQEVTYLGMIISTNGIRMDPQKVECINNWDPCENVKDVQAFLGFSNFYRRFIKGFSKTMKPLVALTQKNVKFSWSKACEHAFAKLKKAFVSAPILQHFDPSKEVFVEADASDFVSSGVLSQIGADGILHPVAFMSKKYNPAECNYEIYDKELLAIVRCFESWRSELQGAEHPISVITDHSNLAYFMTTKHLTRRQVRWSEFLSEFDFKINYRPGKQGGKPDALTRRSQDLPKDDTDERIKHQHQTLLKPHLFEAFKDLDFDNDIQLCPAILEEIEAEEPIAHKITRLLDEGYKEDAFWLRIKKEMTKTDGIPHSREVSLSECDIRDDRLFFRDRFYVPNTELRVFLLQTAHDSFETGHTGKHKLYEVVSRDWWWPNLSKDCAQFTRNCHSCKRNQVSKLRYQGALKPLPLPIQRWRDISVDFIGPLPLSNGFDCIMVVVDRLTKERHYSACNTTMKAHELGNIFVRDIYRLHGLPDSIVSDRGPLFVSEFWKAVCHRLQTTIALSTAYHPETDGGTENANAYLEQYLRHYVNYAQDDWETWLPLAEFAVNNVMNISTSMSPFFANKGFHPRMSFGPPRPIERTSSNTLQEQNKAGNSFAEKMEDILKALHTHLKSAQVQQEESASANRSPAPAYRVGDMVFLSTRNITTARPSKKLDSKFIGECKIIEIINSHAYKLELPFEHGTIHDVFHTSLLRPAPNDPLPGQKQAPQRPIALDAEGEQLWAINNILDSERTKENGFRYLIHWRGHVASEGTWEPLVNVVNAKASIKEFETQFPHKLRPTKKELTKARKSANSTLKKLRQQHQEPDD
jgi:hypothetical protein